MFPFLNHLINSPLLSPNRLLFLFIIQRVLAQQQQFSLYSRHDIVDKTVKAAETFLSAQDLENMPDREVDLRELGIRVETDPTLGTRNRGDIAELPPSLRPQFDANGLARNSIRQPYRRWPRNEIPYALSSQYGAYSRSVIAKAMDEYHSKTCVRFVPRDLRRHRDYVYIHPDDGCYSLVGRTGGKQPLSLDSGCIQALD
uniref:Peptidase M12A domain-containing protein n=1 Tax=Meloidogyne javanica TaxID=6303 RepID=A0A915M2I3_MELJA